MEKLIQLEIVGEEGLLKANQLSNFLYYFRAAYSVAVDRFGSIPPEELIGKEEYFRDQLKDSISEVLHSKEVWQLCFDELGEDELFIESISRNSPYKIWARGLITALVLAVIISGGEVDLSNGKFTLNPLGEGISALRQAFNPPTQTFTIEP